MNLPSTRIRNKPSALDVIRDWYLDKRGRVTLSEKQEAIRQRLVAAWTLLTNYHSTAQAVPVHAKQFNISEALAFRDMRDAIALFGNVHKAEKEGMRYIIYEFAVKAYQLAAKNGDYAAMVGAVGKMTKLLGLDQKETDLPDFSKMQPTMVAVVLDEHTRALIQRTYSADGGVIDVTSLTGQLMEGLDAEEIPFESVITTQHDDEDEGGTHDDDNDE